MPAREGQRPLSHAAHSRRPLCSAPTPRWHPKRVACCSYSSSISGKESPWDIFNNKNSSIAVIEMSKPVTRSCPSPHPGAGSGGPAVGKVSCSTSRLPPFLVLPLFPPGCPPALPRLEWTRGGGRLSGPKGSAQSPLLSGLSNPVSSLGTPPQMKTPPQSSLHEVKIHSLAVTEGAPPASRG